MGVTDILHFRRILRRGRQVADGNRQYVIGSDKSGGQTPQSLPKGSHFTVVYDRCRLNPGEQDACNNNGDGTATITSSSTTFPTGTACTETIPESSVVMAMIPASSQTYNLSNSHPPEAVVTTTELQEVQFFAQVDSEISTRTN